MSDIILGRSNMSGNTGSLYSDSFAQGPTIKEQDVLNLVNSRKETAMSYYRTFFRKVRSWYDWYRGIYTGTFPSYRNNIHIPLLFSAVWSDTAYKVMTCLGQSPVVEFRGLAPEDSTSAQKVEVLVNEQMKDCDTFNKAVAFNSCADIYGTAIARIGWKNKVRMRKYRGRNLDKEFIFEGKVTEFNGPDWDNVDILDFWPQPGKNRLDKCNWVIHRYYMDLDDILEDQAGPEPMFDKQAVIKLMSTPLSIPGSNQMRERMNVYRSYSEYQAKQNERYSRPVEMIEMWGLVPREFAVNGVRDVVITVANDQVVMRYESNPFWNMPAPGPFRHYCPMPDPHYFHGTGKVEVGEKMQAATNKLVNQKLDAIEVASDPMYVASRQANIDFANLYTKPGRIFQVDGPTDGSVFAPITPNMEGVKMIFSEMEVLRQAVERGIGLQDDVGQGVGTPGTRETAKSVSIRKEAMMTRIGLEARIFEEMFVERLANDFHGLNQQFLSLPRELQMLGSRGIIDQDTGQQVKRQRAKMEAEDLMGDYKARAIGATQMLSKTMKSNAMMLALQATSSNPIMMQVTNWVSFANELYRSLDLDPTQLLVETIPAINQLANAREMSPEELVNMVYKQQQQGMDPGQIAGMGMQQQQPGAMGGQQIGGPAAAFPPMALQGSLNG